MRPKQITVKNFAGKSFSYPLRAVNMVIGNNFSGKTTVEDAIRVALTGYHDRLGKTNQAVFSLAGNSMMMSVRMDLDPSGTIEHIWTKNARGEVKHAGTIPPEFRVPPILLDPKIYFGLTSEEKVKMVFREIPIPEFDWADILGQLKLAELPEPRKGVTLSEDIRTRVESQLAMDPPLTTQVILDGAVDYLKASRKESVALSKQALQTVEVVGRNKPQFPGKIADRGPEIAIAETKHKKLESEIRAIQRNMEYQTKAATRKKEIEYFLAKETPELLVKFTEDIRTKLTELEEKRRSPRLYDVEAIRKQRADWLIEKDKLLHMLDEEKDESDSHQMELEDMEALGKCSNPDCPYQHSQSELVATKKQIMNQIQLSVQKTVNRIAGIEKLCAVSDQTLYSAVEEVKASNQLDLDIASLKSSLEVSNDKLKVRQSLEAELSGINSLGAVSIEELEPLVKDYDVLSGELRKLIADQSVFVEFTAWKARSDISEKAAVEHSREVEVVEKMLTILQTRQEDIATAAFNTLLEKARLFTDGILLSPLEYRNGELGRVQDSAWIPHETFSGTEKLLAYAGLCVALAQKTPMKVVLMDELGVLDRNNKIALITRMVELTYTGDIDLFVGADVSDYPYSDMVKDSSNINIIKL